MKKENINFSAKKAAKKKKEILKQIPWFKALDLIRPFIFKISTPTGSGTGFQISYSPNKKLCGIATAYHVISHAYRWGEPIEVMHYESKKKILLKESFRIIFIHPDEDLAFILFNSSVGAEKLPIKSDFLKIIDPQKNVKQGVEIGWCGFPSVAPQELCFFNGCISCYIKKEDHYLVDGVAINGVSGGPVFWLSSDKNELKVCGVVLAYISNINKGEISPGVCVVKSVEGYQGDLRKLRSLDEAAKKEAEEKEKQRIEAKNKIEDFKPPDPNVSPGE